MHNPNSRRIDRRADALARFRKLPPPAWHSIAAWLGIALLFVLEYGLFSQYVVRELAWAPPGYHDQSVYLGQSYDIFETIVSEGVWKGIVRGWRESGANGTQLSIQGALLYLFLGTSRLTALTLNFAYFLLFQAALAATLRWYSGRWSAAFLGIGLALTAKSTFLGAGGMMDFRIDFVASCLFGTFICVVSPLRPVPLLAVVGCGRGSCGLFGYVSISHGAVSRRRPRFALRGLLRPIGGSIATIGSCDWHACTNSAGSCSRARSSRPWSCRRFSASGTRSRAITSTISPTRNVRFDARSTDTRMRWLACCIIRSPCSSSHAGADVLDSQRSHAGCGTVVRVMLGIDSKCEGRDGAGSSRMLNPDGTFLPVFAVFCVIAPLGVLTCYGSPSPAVGSIAVEAAWLLTVVLRPLWLLQFCPIFGIESSGFLRAHCFGDRRHVHGFVHPGRVFQPSSAFRRGTRRTSNRR